MPLHDVDTAQAAGGATELQEGALEASTATVI